MSIIKAIDRAYLDKDRRGWAKLYWFMDVHGTMIKPNYEAGNIPKEFYEHVVETLSHISELSDSCLVMYTCSHPNEIEEYIRLFSSLDIKFDYVNENPEVQTQMNGYGCYDKKPYMNILFDDKSGFDPEEDWKTVLNYLRMKELN